MQLTQSLHKARRECANGIAVVDGSVRLTHAEFADRVARTAAVLRQQGVQAGDRVAILGLNGLPVIEAYYVCWWLGAIATPINTRWSAAEMAYALQDSGSRVLLVDRHFAERGTDLRDSSLDMQHILYATDGEAPDGLVSLQALRTDATPLEDSLAGGDQTAALLYTGGTTGAPKGVMQSHRALFLDAIATLAADPREAQPVVLHSAPLFHVGGLSFVLQAAARQARQVMLPAFDPVAVLERIETERITEMFLVPTMLKLLIEHPDFTRRDTSSLRCLIYGAAPMDPALLDQAMAKLPQVQFTQAYGQTEAAPVLTILPGWCHLPQHRGLGKLAAAGRPISTAELRIVDPQGRDLPPGQVGEICARGPTVMQGYWNKPEQTTDALRDGWLHTGDGGYMDTDGYLFVVDRFKDMIISGGENVYSTEVENALLAHPAVAQCAVIGIPDDTWGERVHACIVLRPGHAPDEAALVAHCKTLIAGFKCPRSIEFREALPMSAAGKMLKYQLREPFWKGRKRGVS